MNAKVISNSEVQSWLTCKRQHYFGHILGVEPIDEPRYFTRGNFAHSTLMHYYRMLQSGNSKAMARVVAEKHMNKIIEDADFERVSDFVTMRKVIMRYLEVHEKDDWEILAVEEPIILPLTSEFSFGFQPDLVIREYGEVTIVDHKVVYDFWSYDDVCLTSQLPKYASAYKVVTSTEVKRCMVNQLRYRMKKAGNTDEELFRRDTFYPSDARFRNTFYQQLRASDEIIQQRTASKSTQLDGAVPVLNKIICERCVFKFPCQVMQNGDPVEDVLIANFKPSSYGYTTQEQA